jgi:predicted nucleotidyltransferase
MNVMGYIKDNADTLREKYHLKSIGLFGSHVRGEEAPDSDIDILVEFEPGYETFDNYMDLKYHFEDLFEKKVDLVTVDALKPQLRDIILNEASYA